MPELPEIETIRRGVAPVLVDQRVEHVAVYQRRLRWTVPPGLGRAMVGASIRDVLRRGKYLLLRTTRGTLILHLGMSGSLRVVDPGVTPDKHEHLDLVLANGRCLRLRDPRRFGAVLWTTEDPLAHPLLAHLGPEPLDPGFDGAWLHQRARGRRAPVKAFLMDARVVAGIGNIYATEALFLAGIHPGRAAGRIARARYDALAAAVRGVLQDAIRQGGTTLRDFVRSDGAPGYFSLRLRAYGKQGDACERCGHGLLTRVIAQRSSVYCARCQR
ncbi:MAG: bifunctional DNA-formamidopyrimidine glycosylase/DNA-(apurinic or apyrimidinic site) lyase [Gammaproteobacteria bacterium]|nr:bifunctional DNA-formamidopyrimidine glycosylase/DNA-(apurinic or apyrimidinic site) lyase [Gammaproteobacteria bacterium]NIR82217.1 bifunctional DNA-formamidopyrimidine glycosylase/DNA-(apurinic or apyrimidinic site) lyase [Gammaproteobacteria bacterium]NIR90816.1 bifunctional DNA-formamidopyrimidine glycosylase/DNA-(apurinic or apyrimidinic site) lyase [Gammaproteobacteria bacterium]NIU03367.1 bifunctional DNA-formamidopyrimidine glycosylase/DNA-(apurinic or apyrimidinic site) lyase [Gammap